MRTFVLGGTGFIGGHLSRALVAGGHEVTCLARSDTAEIILAGWGIDSIRGDGRDLGAIAHGVRAAECVVFAARLGDEESILVDWLIEQVGAQHKSLVFCSGTGVLGKRTDGIWSEETYTEWDEFEPAAALNHRFLLEKRVRAASARGASRGIVVRPPAVWAHDMPHMLVSGVIDSVRITGSACYVGDGLNMYSHVHAADLGNLFRSVVERGHDGAVYHAVGGEVPNRWIAETVSRMTGAPLRSVTIKEAVEIWGEFAALAVFGTSSRSRSPRSRHELNWEPEYNDMLAAAEKWIINTQVSTRNND